jgi:hypothetical protein
MRPTTKSEKFLLGLLALVIFGGVIFFGYSALSQRQQALGLERASLKADQAEAEVDLQQMPLWQQRARWIKDNEPPMGEEGDTRAQVLNAVVKGARDHHLEIEDQNLGEVQHGPGGVKVNAEVRVKGSMEGLCRWLAEMQKPASFYAIDLFSLKADQDMKSMVCTLRVTRCFREAGK